MYFLSGKPGATDKHLQRPSTSSTQTKALFTTTHCPKYCINKYFYIYTHISPAMPLISGTMLTYTEWCSETLKKVFLFQERYQRLREIHKRKTMKKVPYGCARFLETSLPQSDTNQVNTSLKNGDGNLQCTAVAKCNNLYETFIFLY